MVSEQLEKRQFDDEEILRVMGKVPRHLFVPDRQQSRSYEDCALPIGWGQTISQPYMVALMTRYLGCGAGDRVLEIGTGSGYQAAVLAEMGIEVYTMEIHPLLAEKVKETLVCTGYGNVHAKAGDASGGWPEHAPFDGIIVTASPREMPVNLLPQLKPGGKMIVPVGVRRQELFVVSRDSAGRISRDSIMPVLFVPMTGENHDFR